ncbi:MAG: membrane dipeptidase [Solirubrobacterales bacterium]
MAADQTPPMDTAIADLHCHYPMHLPEAASEPDRSIRGVPFAGMESFDPDPSPVRRLRMRAAWVDRLRAWLLKRAAEKINYPGHGTGAQPGEPEWRVSLKRLRRGNVRFVFSVLYQPFAELDFGKWPEGRPEDGYFRALSDQLTAVEADLARLDREGELHRIIRSGADLQAAREGGQTAFLHCVEGGFHLGDSTTDVRRNVGLLADAGVVYITLAHLFFRRMAKNANALPFLKDWMYRLLFWQLGPDVTKLGRAAIEEMYERRILIDISHMREDAIAKTFDLLGELDRESGRTPSDYPVIATHAAFRFGNQRYNLTPATIRRIANRGGVIGLIFAQHQINERLYEGETKTLEESLPILKRHVDEIRRHGGHEVLAIGSDFDGFIKPTLGGFDHIDDLAKLGEHLDELCPDHGQGFLSGNALRVLETTFAGRER